MSQTIREAEEVSQEAQERVSRILAVPEPKKTRTTAGKLRAKFESLIDRDEELIHAAENSIRTYQLRINAWQEAIAILNSDGE